MLALRVKIFSCHGFGELESSINNWIKEKGLNVSHVLRIEFSTTDQMRGNESYSTLVYSALVSYQEPNS